MSESKPKSLIGRQAEMYRGLAGAGTLGLEIALAIGIGLVGGRWLDNRWKTSPWISIVGVVVGIIVAAKAVYRVVKLLQREAAEEERKFGNPKPLYESTTERAERRARGEPGNDDPVVEKLPFKGNDT